MPLVTYGNLSRGYHRLDKLAKIERQNVKLNGDRLRGGGTLILQRNSPDESLEFLIQVKILRPQILSPSAQEGLCGGRGHLIRLRRGGAFAECADCVALQIRVQKRPIAAE